MIKQAMEMRALVIIGKIHEQSDINGMLDKKWNPLLEELFASRFVLTCAATAEGGPNLTRTLVERCLCRQLSAFALVLNNVSISDRDARAVLKRLRIKGNEKEGYWPLVRGVQLSSCDVGREALAELQELLMSRTCALESLDLSFTTIMPEPLVQVLRGNGSLTSLDVRKVPRMPELYDSLAQQLLLPDASCKLGFLRCDVFEVLEEEPILSLKETSLSQDMSPGGLQLLSGLISHNTTIRELDLTATDIDKDGAMGALSRMIKANTSLRTLRLKYNPALDEEAKEALKAAAASRATPLALEL